MNKKYIESSNIQSGDQREEIIQGLGIFELRGLARELGVPSPTTLKRDELVQLIMQKLDDGVSPSAKNKSRKGRPVKTLNNLNKIIEAMVGDNNDIFKSTKEIKAYDDIIVFAQEMPTFSLLENQQILDCEGILRVASNVGYFWDMKINKKVFISLEKISEFGLMSGDYLQVCASMMNDAQYIVEKLNTINFIDADSYNPVKTVKTPIINYETMPYGDFKLFRGRRNVIQYKGSLYEDDRFVEFVKYLTNKGDKVIVLGLNTSFEDSITIGNVPGIINLTTGYGDKAQLGLEKVVDAIALSNRLNELGENVILFVDDIVEILNTLDNCYSNSENIMGHTSEAAVIAQKIISLARAYSDGSSLSLVLTYRDLNGDDKFLINEVLKVGNRFE